MMTSVCGAVGSMAQAQMDLTAAVVVVVVVVVVLEFPHDKDDTQRWPKAHLHLLRSQWLPL